MSDGPRILTLDLETLPAEVYVFAAFKQDISMQQIKTDPRVGAFSYMWQDSNTVGWESEYDYKTRTLTNREGMLRKAFDLLDEADIVEHYNGNRFDIPWLRSEFQVMGWGKPSPWRDVDLYQTVKKGYWFVKKLDYITRRLGLEGKIQHRGFQLWVDCVLGDHKGWLEMRRYGKQDTRLTQELRERLFPWIDNYPNLALYRNQGSDNDGAETTCSYCFVEALQRRGYKYTQAGRYRRYQCTNCGKWQSENKAELTVGVR